MKWDKLKALIKKYNAYGMTCGEFIKLLRNEKEI